MNNNLRRWLKPLTLNTFIFNFHYFPLLTAWRLPVFVSHNTKLISLKGTVNIPSKPKTGLVQIGYGDVGIFDKNHSRTIWQVTGNVRFKGNTDIGHGSKISVGDTGNLVLGNNFKISAESKIICHKQIRFGDNCLLSWDILILDTDFHKIFNHSNDVINPPKGVLVGDNVWIGCNTVILKGAKIANNCVIAAGSIVSNNLKSNNCIYGGNPATILKKDIRWEK